MELCDVENLLKYVNYFSTVEMNLYEEITNRTKHNLIESVVKDNDKKLRVALVLEPVTVLNGLGQNRLSSLDYFESFIYLIRLECTVS